MNIKSFLIMIILSYLFTGVSYAQSVNRYLQRKANQSGQRATNRADQNVNNKVNSEVDKAVDNAFNKLWGNDKDKKDNNAGTDSTSSDSEGSTAVPDNAANKAMMKSMGISTDVKVDDNYKYSGNIKMTVQSWDDKGKSEGEIKYTTYINQDNTGFAMEFNQPEKGRTFMIFDYKNGKMIMMAPEGNDKTGIVMEWQGLADSLKQFDYTEPQADDQIEDFSKFNQNLKRTGNTKRIAGYKCDEYIYDDETSNGVLWMTDELPPELWANMFSSNAYSASSMGFYGGFVMEMDAKQKDSQERTTMLVNEVNRDQSKSISTQGYQFMSIGSKQMMQPSTKSGSE